MKIQVELWQSPWRWCLCLHWLKLLVKVFKRLYLLNLWMEIVHICHDVSYWSEVLCCAILTYMSDLDLRVMDVEYADSTRAVDVESAD